MRKTLLPPLRRRPGGLAIAVVTGLACFAAGASGQASTQTPRAASVAAGLLTTCAVTNTGAAYCWGSDDSGQVGNGSEQYDVGSPVRVSRLGSVASISVGWSYTCAVTTVGGAKCWGWNGHGQLGDGTTHDSPRPVNVSGLTRGVAAVSAGGSSCALTTAGGVKCWGANDFGQLGDGTTRESTTPVDVTGLTTGVREVSAGAHHACALTDGGGVKCWGYGKDGELGDGRQVSSSTPVDVSGLTSGVKQLVAGDLYSCALTDGGGVKCWGWNSDGGLGDGTTTNRDTPVDVVGLSSGVASIDLGSPSCALMVSGAVECWGWFGSHLTPYVVPGLTGVRDVAAGTGGLPYACAVLRDGGIDCWGQGASGQLGDGLQRAHNQPKAVLGFGAASAVVCTVPDLSGKTLVQAKRLIRSSGCRVGKVTYAYEVFTKGRVYQQTPQAENGYGTPKRIDVVISKGRHKLRPPVVAGLSADGDRVAILMVRRATGRSCSQIWIKQQNGKAVVVEAGCASEGGRRLVTDFALAGTRVAWANYDYGNLAYCYLMTASLAHPRAHDTGFCGGDEGAGLYIGDFAGSGSLLVFNTWGYEPGVWSLSQDGSTKQVVVGKAAGKVTSARARRFVLRESSGAIDVYSAAGALIRHFAVTAGTAKLDGHALVVQEGDTLRSYALSTGAAGPARRMSGGKAARLGDAAGGIAVYTVGGTVHLLRLSDGKQASITVASSGHAFADITSAGLFYGAGRKVTFKPKAAVVGLLR